MKNSKLVVLSLIAVSILGNLSLAKSYHADELLKDNLTTEQIKQIRQLGRIGSTGTDSIIYETKVFGILTPEQRTLYKSLKSTSQDRGLSANVWYVNPNKNGK